MTIKSILVHIDDNSEIKLLTAIQLAKDTKAKVTAIHIENNLELPVAAVASPGGMMGAVASQDTADQVFAQRKARAASLMQTRELSRKEDYPISFIHEKGEPKQILAEMSRCHDLLVISSDLKNDFGIDKISAVSNTIATHSGRPVLVIPSTATQVFNLKRPLVAWNGTAESARAIADSIPLLAQAKDVSVVTMEKLNNNIRSVEDNNKALRKYLALHKVDVTIFDDNLLDGRVNSEKAESQQEHEKIQDFINRKKNDLLVIGAYGHSQLRELFFNSQTKALLNQSEVPVLLSN